MNQLERTETVVGPAIRALALGYRLGGSIRRRTRVSKGVAEHRSRFYAAVWEAAAAAVGASVERLDGSLLEIRGKGVDIRVRDNLTSLDDPVTLAVAGDKPLVYRLLTSHGIPAPRYCLCDCGDLPRALQFVAAIGGPCVVKPARRTAAGAGVTTGVSGRLPLALALASAGAHGGEVLVEEQVEGDNYRLLYFDGELLDAVMRGAPGVHGDGRSSVRELIAKENSSRLLGGIEVSQSIIGIDSDVRHTLRRQGYVLSSVPPPGAVVQVKTVVNDNRREDNQPAAGRLCAEVVDAGSRAAAALGVRLAGVDIITSDPGIPLEQSAGVVLEVNTTPGYYYHYMQEATRVPVAELILRRLQSSMG